MEIFGLIVLSACVGGLLTYGLMAPRASVFGMKTDQTFDEPRVNTPGYRSYMRALRKG